MYRTADAAGQLYGNSPYNEVDPDKAGKAVIAGRTKKVEGFSPSGGRSDSKDKLIDVLLHTALVEAVFIFILVIALIAMSMSQFMKRT